MKQTNIGQLQGANKCNRIVYNFKKTIVIMLCVCLRENPNAYKLSIEERGGWGTGVANE